ncbi:MAG: transposase [Acidimicrobiales bacterium]
MGVDVGVTVLAAVADDRDVVELVPNPAPLTRALHRLERAQQALAACRRDSNRRRRARRRVARLHEQVRQQRRQHDHQPARAPATRSRRGRRRNPEGHSGG